MDEIETVSTGKVASEFQSAECKFEVRVEKLGPTEDMKRAAIWGAFFFTFFFFSFLQPLKNVEEIKSISLIIRYQNC